MAEDSPAYPCQKVTGDGQLCMEPCDPGFVQCRKHRQGIDRRGLATLLETAQERVLRRVESALDDAIDQLIELSTTARNESARIAAIDKLLTLAGFANIKIDAQVGVALDPQSRDQALIGIIQGLARDPDKLAELENKIKAIDVKSAGD